MIVVSNGICDHQTCDQEMLGFALPCDRRGTACVGYVLYPRIETLAADGDATASVTLGHVMAHEIGHLLLGPGHTPSGIMQARWNRDVLQSAARDDLHFTDEQSARLQAAVATGLKSRQAEGMSIAALSQTPPERCGLRSGSPQSQSNSAQASPPALQEAQRDWPGAPPRNGQPLTPAFDGQHLGPPQLLLGITSSGRKRTHRTSSDALGYHSMCALERASPVEEP